jgi:hypothetical protein
MSQSKAHPETLREHHLRASRWEGVRSEYFTRYGSAKQALECSVLSRRHLSEARQAAIDAMKPPPRS